MIISCRVPEFTSSIRLIAFLIHPRHSVSSAIPIQVPADTAASILTSGLLGEQYIGVEAGSDEKNLAAGDTIASTQSAVVLENLIGQFLYSKAAEGNTTNNAPAPAPAPAKK